VVQENELEYLEMTVKLSEMISKKAKNGKNSKPFKPFQNLIFLLRDFPDDDDFALGYEGGDAYLNEEVLSLNQNSNNDAVQSVRENIHNSFENINGFLLPIPGEAVRKSGFDGRWKDLKRKFITNLEKIIESIFTPENLVKKKIFDVEVTGETYRQYILDYFQSFKSGDLPRVESLLQMTIMRQMQILMDKLTVEYKSLQEQIVDLDEEHLMEKIQANHEAAKSSIFLKFDEADSMADGESKKSFRDFLTDTIEKYYGEWEKSIKQRYEEHRRNKLIVAEMAESHQNQTRQLQLEAEERQRKLQADLDSKLENVATQNKEEREKLIRDNDEKQKKLQEEMALQLQNVTADNEEAIKALQKDAFEQQNKLKLEMENKLRKSEEDAEKARLEIEKKAKEEQEKLKAQLNQKLKDAEERSTAAHQQQLRDVETRHTRQMEMFKNQTDIENALRRKHENEIKQRMLDESNRMNLMMQMMTSTTEKPESCTPILFFCA
jgi:hypothetical protein